VERRELANDRIRAPLPVNQTGAVSTRLSRILDVGLQLTGTPEAAFGAWWHFENEATCATSDVQRLVPTFDHWVFHPRNGIVRQSV
jgi:hypothetical protein